MAWTPVDSGIAGFADGNAGHTVNLNAAPQANDLDVIVANSDTIVSTPSGFTSAVSAVSNQGSYIFYRFAAGTEGATAVVTTSGDFNCAVGWSRWRGGNALDVVTSAQINSSVGASTPAVDTGALAETGELVIAAACLHRLASPEPTSPVWSSGYTALTTSAQGTGTSGCVQYVGYKTGAGTAAEQPSVSWTDGAFDRYALVATFTLSPTVTPATVTPASVDATAAVPAPSVSAGATVTPSPVVALAAFPGPTVSVQSQATVTPPAVAALATIPTPGVSAGATATPAAVAAVADLPAPTVTALTVSLVTPATVAAVTSLPPPLLSQGATVQPGAIAAVATILLPVAGTVVGFGGWGVLVPSVANKSTLVATVSP